MIPALDALTRLQDGNRRFMSDIRNHGGHDFLVRREEVQSGQNPFAIILGCSDSRVPAEIIFDQGLGDLFVIRVAGNIVCPSQIGSIEMAAQRFGTRLVVVLGHSRCGAILATFEYLENPGMELSPNLTAIVDQVRPSMESLHSVSPAEQAGKSEASREAFLERAVRSNIVASVNHLRTNSTILKSLIESEGLLVVGAEYSLATGQVEYFDGVTG